MTNTSTSTATLIEVDPAVIALETNVRTEATIDAGFLASIRANGVLTPALGYRDADGTVRVRAGQRRVLAAREVGLASIPVYLVDGTGDDADRKIQQLVENEHRDSMTDADKVAAYKALELDGLSVTAIAKRTGTKRDVVKTSLAVADNATAAVALTEHAVTLDQAAVLMEFDDATVASLVECARTQPGQFAHAAQRARDERARAVKRQEVIDGLTAKGITILDSRPGYYDKTPVEVRGYATADWEKITEDTLAGLEGASAYVQVYYGGNTDVTLYVEDPKAHGFKKRASTGEARTPMTDEQKAERKTLIENNRAWDAAETVRREWLGSFLTRKALPKNAVAVVAELLTSGRHQVGDAIGHGNTLAATLLGAEGESGYGNDRLPDFLVAHPNKTGHVNLAIVLGGMESHTDRMTWRSPGASSARYLRILADWGYALSPVERIAAMLPASNDQDDATE